MNATTRTDPQGVAVVGAGVVNTGWMARFLAERYDADATEPAPGAEDRLSAQVGATLGAIARPAKGKLRFTADMAAAVSSGDFIQESVSEREDFKRELIARIDVAVMKAAETFYCRTGMSPLVLRREVPGFPVNRLQEALWREALWIVDDGIASTAEVDLALTEALWWR